MFDEFEHYCQASTSSLHLGPPVLEWWINNEAKYPDLSQWAYDIHSIPAMSAECERVFSLLLRLMSAYLRGGAPIYFSKLILAKS